MTIHQTDQLDYVWKVCSLHYFELNENCWIPVEQRFHLFIYLFMTVTVITLLDFDECDESRSSRIKTLNRGSFVWLNMQ